MARRIPFLFYSWISGSLVKAKRDVKRTPRFMLYHIVVPGSALLHQVRNGHTFLVIVNDLVCHSARDSSVWCSARPIMIRGA